LGWAGGCVFLDLLFDPTFRVAKSCDSIIRPHYEGLTDNTTNRPTNTHAHREPPREPALSEYDDGDIKTKSGKNTTRLEYSDAGTGDYRVPSFSVVYDQDGSSITPLTYAGTWVYLGQAAGAEYESNILNMFGIHLGCHPEHQTSLRNNSDIVDARDLSLWCYSCHYTPQDEFLVHPVDAWN
jgi:hypothetical protein